MKFNLHTHTARCGHATGNDEEYVLQAIEHGFTDLGFSCHVPLLYDCGIEGSARIPMAQVTDYVSSVLALKEKYKDKINVHLGFECEYLPAYFDKMLENVISWGAEYLILGQHFYEPEFPPPSNWQHAIHKTDDANRLIQYTSSVISAMKTGKFSYVAHPDMFNFVGDESVYKEQVERICKLSKEMDIPLEINLLGIRDNRNYPNAKFWEVAGKVGCPVTMGSDAHSPYVVYCENAVKTALKLIEKYNLKYVGMARIIPLV